MAGIPNIPCGGVSMRESITETLSTAPGNGNKVGVGLAKILIVGVAEKRIGDGFAAVVVARAERYMLFPLLGKPFTGRPSFVEVPQTKKLKQEEIARDFISAWLEGRQLNAKLLSSKNWRVCCSI